MGFFFVLFYYLFMKYVVGIRKELGFRIVFNLFGLFSNFLQVKCQVIGVYFVEKVGLMVSVLEMFQLKYVMFVLSCDGLDEFLIIVLIDVIELKDGECWEYIVLLEVFGFINGRFEDLQVELLKESVCFIQNIFENKSSSFVLFIIVFNVGVVIYMVGIIVLLKEGMELVLEMIISGGVVVQFE